MEATRTKDGCTALMEAVSKGRTEAARTLLKRGADVNRRNKNGYTALILASFTGPVILAMHARSKKFSIPASERRSEMVRLLLNAGSDPNAATDDGN